MNKKTDMEIVKELQEKAEKEEAETLSLFNIDDFMGKADELHEVKVKGVGIVQYKKLDCAESSMFVKKLKAEKIESDEEKGLHYIAAMMHKADGKTTAKKLKQLPNDISNKLIKAFAVEVNFS